MHESIYMANLMLQEIKITPNLMDDPRYDYLFTVEAVNRLVLSGVPFREAYRKVGDMVARGEYVPDKKIAHTHKGSTGNLCNAEIRSKMEQALDQLK